MTRPITQLLVLTFCDTPARIEPSFRKGRGRRTEAQTDFEVEIAI